MKKRAKPVPKSKPKPAKKPAPKKPAASSRIPNPKPVPPPSSYERHRASMGLASRERSAKGREIGPLPPVKDPARRAACRDDDELFLRTYFPARFPLPFCAAHREAIQKTGRCLTVGGLFALALMRGGGKTTIAEALAIKALAYGFRRFLALVQATGPLAERSLAKIRREFEVNELLAEDFPEICYPIRMLERITQRAKGQTLDGKPTLMEWKAEGIVLPTINGSPSSGSAIFVVGITAAFKGLSMAGPDGEIIRPDAVIIDDAQTRESAKSPTQTVERESIICDDILALAGPTTTIATIMLCSPIYLNDLSERFLDRDKHPEWAGVRTSMLPKFPDRLDLWDEYAELRRQHMRDGGDGSPATEFYRERREAMDAGAVVTWPERMKAGEISGLQSAMNLYYDNPRGFGAEYQCRPKAEDLGAGVKELASTVVAERKNGCERLRVPAECARLTCFVDPGLTAIWYAVVAWNEFFGGAIADYGCYPAQSRSVFEAADARPSLKDQFPGYTDPQLVFAGLDLLVPAVLGRTYLRQGGGELRMDRCLIDSGWETKAVYQWVRQSDYAALIYPSKGVGRTLTSRGVSEWKARPGERAGYHWRLTVGEEGRTRAVQFDPDAWKSFLHAALSTPPGGPKGLTLWGGKEATHELIGNHCAAEYSTPVTVRGVTFDKWQVRPDRPDNHLLDVLTGCAVAASVSGLSWSASEAPAPPPEPKRQIKWSEIQARKRAEREGAHA